MARFLLFVLFALLLVAPPRTSSEVIMVRIGSILWYTDYDQALAEARQQGKPLWLHFGENPG